MLYIYHMVDIYYNIQSDLEFSILIYIKKKIKISMNVSCFNFVNIEYMNYFIFYIII